MSERSEYTFLGKLFGTATGWDEGDNLLICLYEFEPAIGLAFPSGDVWFDFNTGMAYAEDGNAQSAVSILEVLR